MFVQIMQGSTSDPKGLLASFDRWSQELAPGGAGWLGMTGGITEDGRVIAMMRYESEDAARRNAERPEQEQWWSETEETFFDGGATVQDSSDVMVDLQGDPDQAGFVQAMQGRSSDPDRVKELMGEDPDVWATFRPDVLGSVGVGHPDGSYTMFLYFTSEAEAREGEKKEAPQELQAAMEEMDRLAVGEPDFFDLKNPMLRSA